MRPVRFRTRLLPFGLLLAVSCMSYNPPASAAFKHLEPGMTVPSVDGVDLLTGESISTKDEGEGTKALVIAFWATWSDRSLDLLADLKAMSARYHDSGLGIIAINVETHRLSPEVRERIARTVTELDLPYPVIIDERLEIFYEFGVVAVPSTAILNSQGILRYGPSGYSYTIRDQMVDSTEVLLGLKQITEIEEVAPGYVPDLRAARYHRLAVRLANQRLYERALANIDQAVQADSAFSSPHSLRGQVLLAMQQPERAALEYEHAVALDSTSVVAWAGWGRAILLQGQPDEAVSKLEVALGLDASYTPALVDLARCRLEKRDYDTALAHLQAALELNPVDPMVHYHRGMLYRSSGRKAAAVGSFRSALEILYPSP